MDSNPASLVLDYLLRLRNSQYAREFIRANDGEPSGIQKIEEEY